jgi:hypothetical protein
VTPFANEPFSKRLKGFENGFIKKTFLAVVSH